MLELISISPLLCGTAILLYLVCQSIYSLYFHPLANFPGPRLAASSRLYEAYYDVCSTHGGQFTARVKELHAKYGPIVRISPTEISINDPDFHEKLYAPQPAIRDKIPMIANILGTTAGTFGTLDHFVHRKRRAASSIFFSASNVSKADQIIRTHVNQFCELLKSAVPSVVREARVQFMALKLDIFYDFAFDDSLGLLSNDKSANEWDETMEAIATCAPFVKLMPWILPLAVQLPPWLVHLVSPSIARVLRINHRIYEQAGKYSHGEEEHSTKKHLRPTTLFSTLLQSGLPGTEKSQWRISQEGSEMFAASGTTARVMSTCIFWLHTKQACLARLRAELDAIIPDPNDIPSTKVLESLPYMTAVIKESLRLAAPVATRLPLVARESIAYQNWEIPAGTPISVNARDLLHDDRIYSQPFDFQPERWLEINENPIPDRYFVPFNRGTRMCMGKEFAMAELQITIATMVRRLEMELVDTSYDRDVKVIRDCFLSEATPGSRGVKFRVLKARQ